MLPFALTIFTGALLLFLVQPLIAKFILPWFGGGPAVWTTCMLFFQVMLLAGYAYAHLSISRLRPRTQAMLHLGLLVAALVFLPITPGEQWKPVDGNHPMSRILALLFMTIGLPYLVLSTTGPLIQAWFSRARPGYSPYRLYALSNIGSLLALVLYPTVIEPSLSRHAQATLWSVGLGVFALLCAVCAVKVYRLSTLPLPNPENPSPAAPLPSRDVGKAKPSKPAKPAKKPRAVSVEDAGTGRLGVLYQRVLWFVLPACASVLLLAVTNKICQDIAVVPFLWVLPLGLYLVTFIISFDNPRWYWRPFWLLLLGLLFVLFFSIPIGSDPGEPQKGVGAALNFLLTTLLTLMPVVVGIYLGLMFVGCMICHGELYRLKPEARHLTGFYLMISAGGAFGGLFVALVAPVIFNRFVEFHLGLLFVCLLVLGVFYLERRAVLGRDRPIWAWLLLILATGGIGAGLYHDGNKDLEGTVEFRRNFYGVLRVVEHGDKDLPDIHKLILKHGSTTHGLQFSEPGKTGLPTTYYSRDSGVGLTMVHFPRSSDRRIGLVGLGTGTLATYGQRGDYLRIYEINPEVVQLARNRFSYLTNSPARIDVVLGDARLSLEREEPQQFDILVLDAFSSDAIPVHLLTREAFEIYRRHLKPDGVVAIHISNRYLDLRPVVRLLADHFKYQSALIDNSSAVDDVKRETLGVYSSQWVLLSNNADFLGSIPIRDAAKPITADTSRINLWTDEESNLFKLLMY